MKRLLLLTLSTITLTQAENAQAQQTNDLDSIVIRENRFQSSFREQNRNISILDNKQISALPVKTTTELLSYVAGVDLRQRGPWSAQADVSIDGSTFDQVLVLINGVKMSDPQTGHHLMNIPLPISAIDHIEVLRGPAARIYGVNALAGAINIITRRPQQNEVTAQAYSGSSFKTDTASGDTYMGWGVNATASLAGNNQSHMLSVSHDEGNGYRYNTGYNAYKLFYQNAITINSKSSIEATGGYISNRFGANGFYSAPKDIESKETVQTALASVLYTYKPKSNISIRPRVSYRYNNDDYIFVRQKPEVYHNIHETNVLTGELQSTIELGKGTIGAGAEYRSEEINSNNLGKWNRENLGIYGEYRYRFSAKGNAGIGAFANYNSVYGWQVFPGIDAGYYFLPSWKVFVNASTGQRLPTYTDLYYKGPSNIGNDKLSPEKAGYTEGGLQYNHRHLFAQASYFYRNISEFIDWVRLANTDPWQPRNFQSINTSGITFQSRYQLSEHLGLSDNYKFGLNVSYTYLHPQIENTGSEISKYAIEALKHQFIASLQSTFFNKLQFNAATRYQYRINANDYTLVDLRVGYQLNKLNIYADVNNLLDQQYKEIGVMPLPGRWYTLGLRMNTSWK